MSMVLDDTGQRFLDLEATGRPRAAIDYALELTAGGMPMEELITGLLGPIQHQVGLLWQSNHWTAAQEHAATSVIDGVLGALALGFPPAAVARGSVLVACVEGEYHSVPARMGVERLRLDGWDVAFLGASLPAADLQSFAARSEADCVVLSCTVPLFLPGAARSIAAVADLGMPAVAAGAGFGAASRRSERLGASGWIGPAADPTEVLSGPLRAARAVQPDALAAELELRGAEIVAACMDEMFARIPAMSTYTSRQLAHTRADLAYILGYLGVAHDVDETELFDDFIAWLADVLASRNVPVGVLAESLDIVAVVLERASHSAPGNVCKLAAQRLRAD